MDDPRAMMLAMNRYSPAIDAEHPLGPALPAKPPNPTLTAIGDLIKQYQDFPLKVGFGRGGAKVSYKGRF